jgi:bile acid:Na+ symporter, BASS family
VVSAQQAILAAVLAIMVFSIALELRMADFQRVLKAPRPVIVGLIPQFILLPVATWIVTLVLPLPAPMEAAMLLVACCPGGSLSNVITHRALGNTALSVSISALASVLALVLTPLNFSWMIAANPTTAQWLRSIQIDPSGIWLSLFVMLAIPLILGLMVAAKAPALAARIQKPLANFSLIALFAFIVLGLIKERQLLNAQILLPLMIVIAHNALGLLLMQVTEGDRRAITIEGGMQNSGLALGIIALQFNADLRMVMIASLWGIWHIVTGLALAAYWRARPPVALVPPQP